MKPTIPDLTIVCVDCTPKVHLAIKAIGKTLEQITPSKSILLTSHKHCGPACTMEGDINIIQIPHIGSLEDYSRFMIRELPNYISTSHALVVQSDGFVINGSAWRDEWLQYDYAGAPFNPSGQVGNGGFSLRSRHLMTMCRTAIASGDEHPEDASICLYHRQRLENMGAKFMPPAEAAKFSFEGRSWNSRDWAGTPIKWDGQFGFHSLLSVLPPDKKPFRIFHHSGDAGDIIYGLATMRALGGGALFISPDNRYPYPLNSRWARTGAESDFVTNLRPLLEAQPYVDRCSLTHGVPFSTDHDLNAFRKPWAKRTTDDFLSIFKLHQKVFGVIWPDNVPWLQVDNPVTIPDRPIVVSRTPRYHDDAFPWYLLVQKYGKQMVFVGTELEAEVFKGFAVPGPVVPWQRTSNMLELASVIAGAKVFIGNQSAALAIAHGLGKNVIVEEWPENPNCRLARPNALYGTQTKIPERWLE